MKKKKGYLDSGMNGKNKEEWEKGEPKKNSKVRGRQKKREGCCRKVI